MKKLMYPLLVLGAAFVMMQACSSGAYDANPSSPINQAVNPLNPLKISQFTWSGTGMFSCLINGSPWVADTAYAYLDTSGSGNVVAIQYANGSEFFLHYPNAWMGNLYNMGYEQPRYAMFLDSATANSDSGIFYSYLGNSGEFYLQKSAPDTLIAKFYFVGQNLKGQVVNISDGYINWEF